MTDDELRKLAGYVVDTFVQRLGVGQGMAELLKDAEEEEETEAQREERETQEALLDFIKNYEETDG